MVVAQPEAPINVNEVIKPQLSSSPNALPRSVQRAWSDLKFLEIYRDSERAKQIASSGLISADQQKEIDDINAANKLRVTALATDSQVVSNYTELQGTKTDQELMNAATKLGERVQTSLNAQREALEFALGHDFTKDEADLALLTVSSLQIDPGSPWAISPRNLIQALEIAVRDEGSIDYTPDQTTRIRTRAEQIFNSAMSEGKTPFEMRDEMLVQSMEEGYNKLYVPMAKELRGDHVKFLAAVAANKFDVSQTVLGSEVAGITIDKIKDPQGYEDAVINIYAKHLRKNVDSSLKVPVPGDISKQGKAAEKDYIRKYTRKLHQLTTEKDGIIPTQKQIEDAIAEDEKPIPEKVIEDKDISKAASKLDSYEGKPLLRNARYYADQIKGLENDIKYMSEKDLHLKVNTAEKEIRKLENDLKSTSLTVEEQKALREQIAQKKKQIEPYSDRLKLPIGERNNDRLQIKSLIEQSMRGLDGIIEQIRGLEGMPADFPDFLKKILLEKDEKKLKEFEEKLDRLNLGWLILELFGNVVSSSIVSVGHAAGQLTSGR